MSVQVSCDNCGKLFKIKAKTKTHRVNIKETYFRCPHCKKKYISFVIDGECRRLQREIVSLMKSKYVPASMLVNGEINDDEYMKEINKINAEVKEKQQILKTKMDKLKKTLT